MQERDCLVEGPLNNLQTSMMSLPRPKMTSNDKRLHFTALAHGAGAGTSIHASGVQGGHHMGMHGGGGYDHGDQGYYGDNMGHMGGGGGNSFYQRSWGELSSHDNSRYALRYLPLLPSTYLSHSSLHNFSFFSLFLSLYFFTEHDMLSDLIIYPSLFA